MKKTKWNCHRTQKVIPKIDIVTRSFHFYASHNISVSVSGGLYHSPWWPPAAQHAQARQIRQKTSVLLNGNIHQYLSNFEILIRSTEMLYRRSETLVPYRKILFRNNSTITLLHFFTIYLKDIHNLSKDYSELYKMQPRSIPRGTRGRYYHRHTQLLYYYFFLYFLSISIYWNVTLNNKLW